MSFPGDWLEVRLGPGCISIEPGKFYDVDLRLEHISMTFERLENVKPQDMPALIQWLDY